MKVQSVSIHDKAFKRFLLLAHKGFEKGAKEHGEGSNKEMNLLKEIKEELRDVACYAFFQFKKIEALERKINADRNNKSYNISRTIF